MSVLFTPAERLLARLRFAGKFALVGVLFLLPLTLVFFYFQSEINKSIEFAQMERAGVAYERPTEKFLTDVLTHQRLVRGLGLGGVSQSEVTHQADQVDQDVQAVDAMDGRLGATLKATDDWGKIKAQWQNVKSAGAGGSQAAHQALAETLVAFIQTVGNNSNLILDPDVDSYYTMDSALTQMPQVMVSVSRADDLAGEAAHRHALTPDGRTQLTVLTGQISTPLATLQGDVQQAEQFNPDVKADVDAPQAAAAQQTNTFLGVLRSGLLTGSRPTIITQAVRATSEKTADALTQYGGQALDTLDRMLQKRLHGFLVRRDAVDVCVTLSLVLALYFFAALSRSTTRTLAAVSSRLVSLDEVCITNLGAAIQALEHGDLTVRVEMGTAPLSLNTHDELGEVVTTFNAMRVHIQSAIQSFRTSQASLAQLVYSLQSSAALVGGASQSLEALVGQAGVTSSRITRSMREIAAASDQAARGADEVARGSIVQAVSVSHGAERLRRLTQAVQRVAEDAERAAEAVTLAAGAAGTGAATVGQSLTGMASIRETVMDWPR